MAEEQETKEPKWWEAEGKEPLGWKVREEDLDLALKKVLQEWMGEA